MATKKETLNIDQLALKFDLNRRTVRERLRDAGMEGKPGPRNSRLFEITEALEEILLPEARADYERERAGKVQVERQLKELELKERRGELIDRRQIADGLQQIFTKLYQKLVNQQPRELSGALYRAESPEHCQIVLQKATAKIFSDLREEHAAILGEK